MCEPEKMEKPGPSVVGVSEELLISGTDWQADTDEVGLKDEEVKNKLKETTHEGKEPEQAGSKVLPWGWTCLPDLCLGQVFAWLSDQERYQASLVCHHWYRVMRSPWLWRSRIFQLSGRLFRPHCSEKEVALSYARTLGRYLEELEVRVIQPHNGMAARRIQITLKLLLGELVKVKARLHSFTLRHTEPKRNTRTRSIQSGMMHRLAVFLRWNAYHLRHLCLRGTCLTLHQGMEILEVVSAIQEQQHYNGHLGILSLDVQDFFSSSIAVYESRCLPRIMQRFWGLECLRLNYRCVSNEMLEALASACGAAAWAKAKSRKWRGTRGTLRSLFLHCHLSEPQAQVVRGSTWARLAQNCPELAVHIHIENIVDTDRLARILLPEVPVKTFSINSCYLSEEEWSAKPILSVFLPSYRSQLQMLTLDLNNYHESLDDELCLLVLLCEHLVYLKAWAFLDITSVDQLLYNCLEKKCALQTIDMRIYTSEALRHVEEKKLKEVLLNYSCLIETEVKCSAIVYPIM